MPQIQYSEKYYDDVRSAFPESSQGFGLYTNSHATARMTLTPPPLAGI